MEPSVKLEPPDDILNGLEIFCSGDSLQTDIKVEQEIPEILENQSSGWSQENDLKETQNLIERARRVLESGRWRLQEQQHQIIEIDNSSDSTHTNLDNAVNATSPKYKQEPDAYWVQGKARLIKRKLELSTLPEKRLNHNWKSLKIQNINATNGNSAHSTWQNTGIKGNSPLSKSKRKQELTIMPDIYQELDSSEPKSFPMDFYCNTCYRKFNSLSDLKSHVVKKLQHFYCCNLCETIYISKSAVCNHVKSHKPQIVTYSRFEVYENDHGRGGMWWCCIKCQMRFCTTKRLLEHLKSQHRNEVLWIPSTPKKVEAPYVALETPSTISNESISDTYTIDDVVFQCIGCKRFLHSTTFFLHKIQRKNCLYSICAVFEITKKKDSYFCPQCKYEVCNLYNLVGHMNRIHRDNFLNWRNCKRSQGIADFGENLPFTCPECESKRLSWRWTKLRRSTIRCRMCRDVLPYTSNILLHYAYFHPQKDTFVCVICKGDFLLTDDGGLHCIDPVRNFRLADNGRLHCLNPVKNSTLLRRTCFRCGKCFDKYYKLVEHLNRGCWQGCGVGQKVGPTPAIQYIRLRLPTPALQYLRLPTSGDSEFKIPTPDSANSKSATPTPDSAGLEKTTPTPDSKKISILT